MCKMNSIKVLTSKILKTSNIPVKLNILVKTKSSINNWFKELYKNCDHGRIQTYDRWSRNPVLYSAELRGPIIKLNTNHSQLRRRNLPADRSDALFSR